MHHGPIALPAVNHSLFHCLSAGDGDPPEDTADRTNRSDFLVILLQFIGHPFSALTIAALIAAYFLGYRKGFSGKEVLKFTDKAFAPAGLIILVTGAGGVFKQILIDSGFWLVNKYLGLTEEQALKSWTVMMTIVSVVGLIMVLLNYLFF